MEMAFAHEGKLYSFQHGLRERLDGTVGPPFKLAFRIQNRHDGAGQVLELKYSKYEPTTDICMYDVVGVNMEE